MVSLICAFSVVLAPPQPTMTLREARQEVVASVRWTPPKVTPSQNGWNLALKAAKLLPKNFSSPAVPNPFKGPPLLSPLKAPRETKPTIENPSDLLGLINKPGEKDILKRCHVTLKAYEPAFAAIRLAVKRPYWYEPAPRDDVVIKPFAYIKMDFPIFAGFKSITKALVLSAQVNVKEKHPQKAVDDLLLAHLIANRLIESHSNLITQLIGIAIGAIADRSIQLLAADPIVGKEDLTRLLGQDHELRYGTDLAQTLRAEFDSQFLSTAAGQTYPSKDFAMPYGDIKDITGLLLEGHPKPFDRKATIHEASKRYAYIVARATEKATQKTNLDFLDSEKLEGWPPNVAGFEVDDARPNLSPKEIDQYRSALRKVDNPVGKLMIAMLLPVFSQADEADVRSVANSRATKLILAIQIYKRSTGKMPTRLSQLGMSSLIDPYSDGPFHYDPRRNVIWSVGQNLVDDGGKGRVGDPKGLDTVWPTDGRFKR